MLTLLTVITSLLCGGLLGLTYAYCYKKAVTTLYASLNKPSIPAPSNNNLKQRVFKFSGLFFTLRCFFVLGIFGWMHIHCAVNIPLCGSAFIVTFLSLTLILARK